MNELVDAADEGALSTTKRLSTAICGLPCGVTVANGWANCQTRALIHRFTPPPFADLYTYSQQ